MSLTQKVTHSLIVHDVNNDGKMSNDDEAHDNNDDDKALNLNALRASFGAVNRNDGDDSSVNLCTVDLDAHRNASTDLSFDGYQVLLSDKSSRLRLCHRCQCF